LRCGEELKIAGGAAKTGSQPGIRKHNRLRHIVYTYFGGGVLVNANHAKA
jgi:hypothetical protein